MPKVTDKPKGPEVITIKTKNKQPGLSNTPYKWWDAANKSAKIEQLFSTISFLRQNQQSRYRQTALFCKMYQNYPLMGAAGVSSSFSSTNALPIDRPTLNVIQSCIDTMVSRITQSRPRPVFLTDNSDYKQRKTAKDLNDFINGEFYRCKAYDIGAEVLRDCLIMGPGVIKVVEGQDKKVKLERRLHTEVLVDPNEALWRSPRQMYELQLIDRSVLKAMFPDKKAAIDRAENAYPQTGTNTETIADMIMVAEAWRLPSGPDAGDGERLIAIQTPDGELQSTPWEKNYFPFEILNYSERVLGMWGQGLAEQLMGTQAEINKLLITISKSINLVGVPRIFVEDGSKVVKAHLNNEIGSIITYRGTKPSYEVAPCMPQEVYAQLQRLVDYAFQQSGVSALAAASQKPAGLNSGEAIRNYDDLQTDRFASTVKRYDNMYVSLAYKMFDLACDIAERDDKYSTVYPNKNGTKEIDLPEMGDIKDTFVIQCFDASSLPRDPAGRLQKITEMIQSGMVDIKEGRRLLDFPDLEQIERLANSAEERMFQILDNIVEKGKYTPPDPYLNPPYAHQIAIQYYNLYVAAKLEENKAEMLRTFIIQCETLMQAAIAPQPGQAPGPQAGAPGQNAPMAAPQPLPQSPLVPNGGIQ